MDPLVSPDGLELLAAVAVGTGETWPVVRVDSATVGILAGLPGWERALYLSVALATHAAVGYALVTATTDVDPRLGLAFGVIPDVDFLFPEALGFPFVHRGITHTPVFVLFVSAGLLVVSHRHQATATALALFSHLCIDSLSPMGIMWLYPLTLAPSPGLPVHGPVGTTILWVGVVSLLVLDREPTES